MNETARDWQRHTGEYVEEGALDFDVWAYRRPLGGWSIVVRQGAPQQMQEDLGRVVKTEIITTVEVAGGLTEQHQGKSVHPEAIRLPWSAVPPDIQAEVFASASTGWVWGGLERRFDPAEDRWVTA